MKPGWDGSSVNVYCLLCSAVTFQYMTAVSCPAAAVNCGDGSFLKPFPSADLKGLCKSYVLHFYRKGIPKTIRRLSGGGNIAIPLNNHVFTMTASEAALLVDRTNG